MIQNSYIVANWKMNKGLKETRTFLSSLLQETLPQHCMVGIAPSFTNLVDFQNLMAGKPNSTISLYAQNVHQKKDGAFTGEVSVSMLEECGVGNVILGHSERRQYFAESDSLIREKIMTVLHHSPLCITLCVGESLEERESNKVQAVLDRQLRLALDELPAEQLRRISIAYEPVWAIGTGKSATPEMAQESHALIRSIIATLHSSDLSDKIPLLYGGSVKSDTAGNLLVMKDINGLLVGGASLIYEEFIKIIFSHGGNK